MLGLLTTSMLALTAFAQLPQTSQLSEMVRQMTTSSTGQPLSIEECESCHIGLCDNTIQLPISMDCDELNDELSDIKDSLFKDSEDCDKKAKNYLCDVFVGPFEKLTKHICTDNEFDDDLLDEVYEESFCLANENCEDLSRCSWINIDCEYDSDILPYIGESSDNFDEGECPHNDLSEKVKRFFEDYWKDIAISGAMDILLFMTIIVMLLCCCRPKARVVQDRNMV